MDKKISYYVAVFIDILGQGEKLSQVNKLPKTEAEEEEFIKFFLETAGAVETLHKSFEIFFKGFTEIHPEIQSWLDASPLEVQEQFLKSKELNLKYLKFSDTVVLYFTLDRENNQLPMKSIYSALASASATFLTMLVHEIPLRGAIDIDIGIELDESGIYGPILHNLHDLESKCADYPRIIVGDELIQMIDVYNKEPVREGDTLQRINKAIIPNIYTLIKTDNDGKNVLNYLDKSLSKAFEEKKEIYKKINSFVDEQYHATKDNEKLHKKYQKLKYFIRRNKSNWL